MKKKSRMMTIQFAESGEKTAFFNSGNYTRYILQFPLKNDFPPFLLLQSPLFLGKRLRGGGKFGSCWEGF